MVTRPCKQEFVSQHFSYANLDSNTLLQMVEGRGHENLNNSDVRIGFLIAHIEERPDNAGKTVLNLWKTQLQ